MNVKGGLYIMTKIKDFLRQLFCIHEYCHLGYTPLDDTWGDEVLKRCPKCGKYKEFKVKR